MSINKVLITGNLTRDAEMASTQGGSAVAKFGVAVNDRRKNANGEWEDYPNFVDCTLFGRRAEALAQYLTKGTKVAIEGKLHYSSWEDRNGGGRRSKLDVNVDEIEFLSSRNSGQQGGYQAQGGYQQPMQQQAPQQQGFNPGNYQQQFLQSQQAPYSDQDIPFSYGRI